LFSFALVYLFIVEYIFINVRFWALETIAAPTLISRHSCMWEAKTVETIGRHSAEN